MPLECEYCNQPNDVLYAWHADIWCRACIETTGKPMTGALDEAPYGQPENSTYAQPWIIPQT